MISLQQLFRRSHPKGGRHGSLIGPIGLELARGEMRMVQLSKSNRGELSVLANSRFSYQESWQTLTSDPKRMRRMLKTALGSSPFSGRKVVAALPPDEVKIMPLAYPKSDKGDGQTILELLAKRIEENLENFVIDYIPVRSNPEDQERLALVAMTKRERVIRLLDLLSGAGMEVTAMDIGPAAINRLFAFIPKPSIEDTILVINSGHEKSYLTIISGRRLLLDQQVDLGEVSMLEHLSEVLDITIPLARELLLKNGFDTDSPRTDRQLPLDSQEISHTLREIFKPLFLKLADEIDRILIFSASETRGNPVSRIYLLGAIAHWPGADKLLDSLLDIPVMTVDQSLWLPARGGAGRHEDSSLAIGPEMVIATGLALRGMNIDA